MLLGEPLAALFKSEKLTVVLSLKGTASLKGKREVVMRPPNRPEDQVTKRRTHIAESTIALIELWAAASFPASTAHVAELVTARATIQ